MNHTPGGRPVSDFDFGSGRRPRRGPDTAFSFGFKAAFGAMAAVLLVLAVYYGWKMIATGRMP